MNPVIKQPADDRPRVALLQRSIAHYRFPLFKKLSAESKFDWTFYCASHEEAFGSGLPAPDVETLAVRPTRNCPLHGPWIYQRGLRLGEKPYHGLLLDLGWTILSNPRYLLEARARGIATVGWSKGVAQNPERDRGFARRTYQRLILALCDALVVYGHGARAYFVERGFSAERIFIAQNTIDTARIAREAPLAMQQKKDLNDRMRLDGRFVFGYLGSLIPRKKVDCIIQAFNLVRATGREAVLVIAGAGVAEPALRETTGTSCFNADIHFVGRVPVGEEGGWFQLFDAYLSFAQGGLGILETMAHGKLVVSTPEKFPETELLKDEETALLSRDFTVESFATRMADAIDRQTQLAQIGQCAKRRVLSEATLENMVTSIDKAMFCAVERRTGKNRK
jgi:glycosyltransferase involved in cell wall biosynthesis